METLTKCRTCKYILTHAYEFPCVGCSPTSEHWEPNDGLIKHLEDTNPCMTRDEIIEMAKTGRIAIVDDVTERIEYYAAKNAESEKKGITLKVKLDEGAYMPERAHEWDAGADLRTPVDFTLHGDNFATIDTGVHIEIPAGYVGMVKSKSGLMTNHGIVTDGTVDAGYTGSIKVCLFNHDINISHFARGDKIAQLVILPIVTPGFEQVEEIEGGDRGDGGFGSTGR